MLNPSIVRERELFENERFIPMSGWSSKGLLMTDRKAISNRDGSLSWSNYEAAEESLLSYGWEWDQNSKWTVDKEFSNTDSDGWIYDVNFGSFENASSKKGMMHFVRRRRVVRKLHFMSKC